MDGSMSAHGMTRICRSGNGSTTVIRRRRYSAGYPTPRYGKHVGDQSRNKEKVSRHNLIVAPKILKPYDPQKSSLCSAPSLQRIEGCHASTGEARISLTNNGPEIFGCNIIGPERSRQRIAANVTPWNNGHGDEIACSSVIPPRYGKGCVAQPPPDPSVAMARPV